jgi:hypothetical protein
MMNLSSMRRRDRLGRLLVLWAITLAGGCLAAHADEEGQVVGGSPQRPVPHRAARSTLEDRVKALTRSLDLDAAQQDGLRQVLEKQREQVRKVWSDESSVPPAYRVSATRTISDATADQIRALLNEEQRKKYTPPRQPRDAAADSTKRSVEDWMNATKSK